MVAGRLADQKPQVKSKQIKNKAESPSGRKTVGTSEPQRNIYWGAQAQWNSCSNIYLGLLSSGQPGALWEVWRSGGEEVAPGNGGRELGFCCVQTGFVPRASSTLSRFLHFQTGSCWAKLRNRWWEPHQQRTKRRRVELRANWANSHTVSTGGMSPKVGRPQLEP